MIKKFNNKEEFLEYDIVKKYLSIINNKTITAIKNGEYNKRERKLSFIEFAFNGKQKLYIESSNLIDINEVLVLEDIETGYKEITYIKETNEFI